MELLRSESLCQGTLNRMCLSHVAELIITVSSGLIHRLIHPSQVHPKVEMFPPPASPPPLHSVSSDDSLTSQDLLKSHLPDKAYTDNPSTTATLTLALLISLRFHYLFFSAEHLFSSNTPSNLLICYVQCIFFHSLPPPPSPQC